MERKFASKLSQLKPAAEARKQASSQLKESILSHKLKLIDPIDYDAYIEENSSLIRKDNCSRQLVLLPDDDVIYEEEDLCPYKKNNIEQTKLPNGLNLLVTDCLRTYLKRVYRVEFKYAAYGENYYDLPGYRDTLNAFNRLIDEKKVDNNGMILMPEAFYEIDAEDIEVKKPVNTSNTVVFRNQLKSNRATEKNGWLNYKISNILNDSVNKEKGFKRFYFHLHQTNSPIVSRHNSIDTRNSSIRKSKTASHSQPQQLQPPIQHSSKPVYVLECFKEAPGNKRAESPRYQIAFENTQNTMTIKNTSAKTSQYTFELIESGSNSETTHQFQADSSKQMEEWIQIIDSVLSRQNKKLSQISSPNDSVSSSSTNYSSSSPLSNGNGRANLAKPEIDAVSSFNESNDSSESFMRDLDNSKFLTPPNQQFLLSFDLNKYLNEKEEDLLISKSNTEKVEQINPFNFYSKVELKEPKISEVESIWPESSLSREIILECVDFRLNLNVSFNSLQENSNSSNKSQINPELFYLTLAFYDASNNQKLSANFSWVPDLDLYLSQLSKAANKTVDKNTSHMNSSTVHTNGKTANSESSNTNIFSLNGRDFNSDPISILNNSELKQLFISRIKKALFTFLDVHDEIYLVVRIEKVLDGLVLSSSVQPYAAQIHEGNRLKMASRLNKKMQALGKSKLLSYRQPFAWAAKPLFKRSGSNNFELDKESKFVMYKQEEQHLSDEDLFKYLSDFKSRERYLNKLISICGEIDVNIRESSSSSNNIIDSSLLLKSASAKIDVSKPSDYVLAVDCFEPSLSINMASLPSEIASRSSNVGGKLSSITEGSNIQNWSAVERKNLIKRAELLRSNDEFKSFLFVYPKFLKYDTQKTFSRARNILIRTELRDDDTTLNELNSNSTGLKCIFKSHPNVAYPNESVLSSSHSTCVTYHNKTPQFYDEIKLLLPLNLTEKHHLLFKFYHVSCRNAKLAPCDENSPLDAANQSDATLNSSNMLSSTLNGNGQKSVETLIGFAWLPLFKNGRVVNGEKSLPVAYNLPSNYLSFEQIGLGQSVGPNNIKWIESMKPLFKVNLAVCSSVHTTDSHLANFYQQCEKLSNISTSSGGSKKHGLDTYSYSANKRRAPILNMLTNDQQTQDEDKKEAKPSDLTHSKLIIIDNNKEILKNSVKALHAADICTVVKFMPVIFNRLLNTLLNTVSSDVAIHSVRALLHFVWQMSAIGKTDSLRSFMKHVFNVDYQNHNKDKSEGTNSGNQATIHGEIFSNLVAMLRQNFPIQDHVQMNRLLQNCWFFFEISLKSLAIYVVQCKKTSTSNHLDLQTNADFYESLKNFTDLLCELIMKYASHSSLSKDNEFIASFRCCNRSLASFIKKSLNILNRKFLFCLISKYLESFHLNYKQLFEIKFEFVQTICNHEHYISFSLPIGKGISNLNQFADMKYEFVLSDQFRQFHFLAGVLLSQLCTTLNESKDQRKIAITIFRDILCKHSYDDRYFNDKTKQSRIASIYIPFIDILMENLPRLSASSSSSSSSTAAANTSGVMNKTKHSQHSEAASSNRTTVQSASSNMNMSSRHMSNSTVVNVVSSSISMSNGSVFAANFESGMQVYNNDPLSVIAGVVNPNKFQDHLDSLIGTMSDNDSLSSADDANLLKQAAAAAAANSNKRASSSLITGSANNSCSDTVGGLTTANNNLNSLNTNSFSTTNTEHSTAAKSFCVTRKDKLETSEVRDLMICAAFVFKNLSHDAFLGLWFNYDDTEFVDFLSLLELCLKTFRYRGKTYIQKLNAISKGQDVKALIKTSRLSTEQSIAKVEMAFEKFANNESIINPNELSPTTQSILVQSHSKAPSSSPLDLAQLNRMVLIESNLCHQVSLIVLNIISLILIHHKEKIVENNGDNQISRGMMEIYFYLLQSNQSEQVKLKVFASLRLLVNKLSSIFLDGHSSLCANLCLETLKCFSSKFARIRAEACSLIYLLARKNYEHTRLKSIPRVHSQTIISVSRLIGTMKLSISNEVLECLSLINHLSLSDQPYKNTRFSLEVDDLTKRIRNIFLATAQMKSFEDDSEMLIDSQYSLAKSYANCLELRRTWLESMASIHVKEKNFSEAAHCYLHIAAFVAENLKHQGMYTLGCSVFKKITPNIDLDELNENNDIMTNGDSYIMNDLNEAQLLDYLCKSAEMLKLAERYDFLPDIFKLAVAIYEPTRDYEHLQQMHQNIQKAYSYLAERDQRSREKPLAAYYRVSFFGKAFATENNKVYIYKEPSNTKLFEVCDRLRKIYNARFNGDQIVEILNDSRKPNELKLDTENKNYIQVTFVQPYFEESEIEKGIGYFERNNNLKKFYYETAYRQKDEESAENNSDVNQHGELLILCKRKTVLETSHWFPYVKKRILVVYEIPIDLNPLETAIDEIRLKIEDFESILKKKDLTLLELYLQGGIMPQVHKGPLAYAEAFLEPNKLNKSYPKELKRKFKITFKRLIDLYQKGIDMYHQLAVKSNTQQPSDESVAVKNVSVINTSSLNSSNAVAQNVNSSVKHFEMSRLLQEKFNELENSFRNLLLIDGDMELYAQQLNNSKLIRGQELSGIDASILTSSQA